MTYLKLPTWLKASLTVLMSSLLLTACDQGVLSPQGAVGMQNKELILIVTGLMLIVVIPVIIMAVWFTYRYRENRPDAHKDFNPEWSHNTMIEVVMWTVPIIIIAILAVITWRTTHELDPYKPLNLANDKPPLEIDVVAQNWKWLFIYPEQNIATVNEIYIPVDREVSFKITSDTVMNSFFIPRLGSQIYAMASMVTQLHLVANEPGVYNGLSSNYSGPGFSDMKFLVHAVDDKSFDNWVTKVKSGDYKVLDVPTYQELSKPSENHPIEYFKSAKPDMFNYIVHQYDAKQAGQNQFVEAGSVNQRDDKAAVSKPLESDLKQDSEAITNPAAPANANDAQEADAHQ
ncbi:MAG: ubiquinol oxidase subunit II [Psychrobacter sp.]|nr:ubiquinol oxidase subunit II [Psychrobacter sp.]